MVDRGVPPLVPQETVVCNLAVGVRAHDVPLIVDAGGPGVPCPRNLEGGVLPLTQQESGVAGTGNVAPDDIPSGVDAQRLRVVRIGTGEGGVLPTMQQETPGNQAIGGAAGVAADDISLPVDGRRPCLPRLRNVDGGVLALVQQEAMATLADGVVPDDVATVVDARDRGSLKIARSCPGRIDGGEPFPARLGTL